MQTFLGNGPDLRFLHPSLGLIVPGLQARGCLASCLRCLMSIDVGVLSDLPHHLTGRCAGLVVDALTSASFAQYAQTVSSSACTNR